MLVARSLVGLTALAFLSGAVLPVGGAARAQEAAASAASDAAASDTTPPEAAPSDTGGPRPMSESVAAVVNDDIISSYDLRQRALLLLITSGVQATKENIPQIEREALRSLIDERLEMQEVVKIEKKNKIKLQPTDKEVDQEVTQLAKQNNLQPEQLVRTFRSAGVDPETLRAQLRAQQSWRRYMGGRFGSNIRISDAQINEQLKRINATAQKEQYLVSEVFVDAARVGGQQAAQDGAKQLVDQLKAGAPFAAVARQFSSLPTAANGGDAGWLTPSEMSPLVVKAVEQMRPGQLSDPIVAQDGVFIVLLRDKRAGASANLVSLKQAAVSLPADAKPERVEAAKATLSALRDKVHGCDTLEPEAAKVKGVVAGDFGDVDIGDLRPEFREALKSLKPGEVSAPLRTNIGVHLIALCGRSVGGAKIPSRDDIENRLYGEQLSMMSKRFLRDLRNSATIEAR